MAATAPEKLGPLPDPRDRPVLEVPVAGAYLGLCRSASYQAARRGDLPVIRVGARVMVPTAALRRLLQFDESTP